MNVRASSTSEMIFTFTIITATLIGFGWFFSTYFYQKPVLQSLESDVTNISLLIEEASFAYSYSNLYNPLTEEGVVTINKNKKDFEACISSKGNEFCRKIVVFDTNVNQLEIDLSKIANIRVTREEGGDIIVKGE